MSEVTTATLEGVIASLIDQAIESGKEARGTFLNVELVAFPDMDRHLQSVALRSYYQGVWTGRSSTERVGVPWIHVRPDF